MPECTILNGIFNLLAKAHPTTKFIRAIATKCVENFRDQDVPALFFYRNGELLHNVIPCGNLLGGVRMNQKTVEFVLATNNMIKMEFEHDPRDKLKLINATIVHGKKYGTRHEEDSQDSGEDDREYVDNQYARYK